MSAATVAIQFTERARRDGSYSVQGRRQILAAVLAHLNVDRSVTVTVTPVSGEMIRLVVRTN